MKTDSGMVAREERGGGGSYLMETEFQFQHMKGSREGPVCTLCFLTSLTYHQK